MKRTEWASALKSTRGQYKEWQSDPDLVIDPHREQGEVNEPEDVTEFDHPLKQSEQSVWYKYFQDNEILHEIEKDVHRTFPHLHFFQIDNPDDTMSGRLIQNEHYRSLRRILFLYAKLNRGISYIQGMNELLAPIYYSFATDPDTEWKSYAEEDAFWCFTNLMSELRDNFDKSHDQAINGIQERMKVFNNILKMKDPALWLDLESKQMNPQFYSFRWITLLLSQEFELPDVLRIWDTLFSDEKRFDQLLYICTAMLIRLRKDILAADFAETLKLLQTYPPCDVLEIIQFSREIAHPDYYYSPPVQEEEQEGEGGTDGIEVLLQSSLHEKE
uniref:TBC1 domain family member 13 n=1 Tax=Arcella intermedia TaxID=1963864 RepID=A0A6B2L745_9EUKA